MNKYILNIIFYLAICFNLMIIYFCVIDMLSLDSMDRPMWGYDAGGWVYKNKINYVIIGTLITLTCIIFSGFSLYFKNRRKGQSLILALMPFIIFLVSALYYSI